MAEKNRQRYNTGVVKHYDEKKGYGFIAPDDGSEELFVHRTAVLSYGGSSFRRLVPGDAVEFAIYFGGDGRTKAVDVKVIHNGGGPVQGSKIRRRGGNGYKSVGEGGRRGGDYGFRGGGYGGGGKSCFNCGEVGHVAMNCNQGGGGGGGGGGRGGCYKCGEDGHFARECPNDAR